MYTPEQLTEVGTLLSAAKKTAIAYYKLTNRPLGITGEIGEYEAAVKLNCTFKEARNEGHDLIDCDRQEVQVKTRCIRDNKSHRVPAILKSAGTKTWDYVLLVLLDENYDVTSILKADKTTVEGHLAKPRPKGGRQRRDMPISEFKRIAREVWPAQYPVRSGSSDALRD